MTVPNAASGVDQIQMEMDHALGGRFATSGRLAQGGQGLVFRSRRIAMPDGTHADDDVALKLLMDTSQDERLLREIEVMERIHHQCLAELLEHGQISVASLSMSPTRYVAWRFIEGGTLSKQIAGGAVELKTLLVVGRDIAAAINECWSRKIVHRDVKPDNIMLRTGGREAVLIDLGIARHLTQGTITAAGTAWGTPGFMSPEQCAGEKLLTCASDVYALGITLLCGLLGQHPFNGDQRAMVATTPNLSQMAAAHPAGLVALLQQMISPRAAFRPLPSKVAEVCTAMHGSLR